MSNFITDNIINNKRVIIRVDYNVPIVNNRIQDNYRIVKSLPTIKYCLDNNASIILISHLGRPKGIRDKILSLGIVKIELEDLLNRKIIFSEDCISDTAIAISKNLKPGEIHLLENLRFHKEEIENDSKFSFNLSEHGDVYINDAFGTAHRSHASNVGITKHIENKFCGFLMKEEYDYLCTKLKNPQRPYTVILGGAKVTGKIELIKSLIEKADHVLVGGAMAFTFLKAKGIEIGQSFYEKSNIQIAKLILELANKNNVNILLPVDSIMSQSINDTSNCINCDINKINKEMKGFDIGFKSCANFQEVLIKSKTIVWNGPLGVAEIDEFSRGTKQIASTMSRLTKKGILTIIGGGDTASAIKRLCEDNHFSHISTGGGASLELLTGKKLPAFEALNE